MAASEGAGDGQHLLRWVAELARDISVKHRGLTVWSVRTDASVQSKCVAVKGRMLVHLEMCRERVRILNSEGWWGCEWHSPWCQVKVRADWCSPGASCREAAVHSCHCWGHSRVRVVVFPELWQGVVFSGAILRQGQAEAALLLLEREGQGAGTWPRGGGEGQGQGHLTTHSDTEGERGRQTAS